MSRWRLAWTSRKIWIRRTPRSKKWLTWAKLWKGSWKRPRRAWKGMLKWSCTSISNSMRSQGLPCWLEGRLAPTLLLSTHRSHQLLRTMASLPSSLPLAPWINLIRVLLRSQVEVLMREVLTGIFMEARTLVPTSKHLLQCLQYLHRWELIPLPRTRLARLISRMKLLPL